MALRDERPASYQQRIWKVTKALDRLALMCEQHRLQTKHVEGLPDWSVPEVPAGVSTSEHVEPPAYFAWTSIEDREGRKRDSPQPVTGIGHLEVDIAGSKLERTIQLPTEAPREVDNHSDVDAESSHGSEDALPVAVQPVPVRSQVVDTTEEKKLALGAAHDMMTRQTRSHVTPCSQTPLATAYGEALTNGKLINVPRLCRRANRPVNAESHRHDDMHGLFRRRKVRFEDHGRNYRGIKQTDLTYHEALQAVAPLSRPSEALRSTPIHPTTYQENYRWPSRDVLVQMMDKVGGQTAGGESRYEVRRVFTTDDAIRVAKESARQFLHRREKLTDVDPESNDPNKIIDPPGKSTLIRVEEDSPLTTVQSYIEEDKHVRMPATVTTNTVDAPQKSPNPTVTEENPETLQESSRSIVDRGVMTDRCTFVDASTQTVSPNRALRMPKRVHIEDKPPEGIPEQHHLRKSRHADRARRPLKSESVVDPPHKKNTVQTVDVETEWQTLERKNVRTARPVPSTYRFNPIFANARYPPEPPIFRSKTTYSRDFGSKRSAQRS